MSANPRKKKNQSKFAKYFKWPLIVLVLSFCLSMAFGILSEVALNEASIIISIIVIIVFLIIAIITDMIGMAVASCDEKNFRAMAAKKVRGAKEAIILQKNADRVSSIFADILGDICGILSGAAGAAVTTSLIKQNMSEFAGIVVASLVSAVIASLLICGKALMKKFSLKYCDQIILIIGKVMSIFSFKKSSKATAKSNKNKKNNIKNKDYKESDVTDLSSSQTNAEKISDNITTDKNKETLNDVESEKLDLKDETINQQN